MGYIVDFLSSSSSARLLREEVGSVYVLFKNTDEEKEKKTASDLERKGFTVEFLNFKSDKIWFDAVESTDDFILSFLSKKKVKKNLIKKMLSYAIEKKVSRYFFIMQYVKSFFDMSFNKLLLEENSQVSFLKGHVFFSDVIWYQKKWVSKETTNDKEYLSGYLKKASAIKKTISLLKLFSEVFFAFLRSSYIKYPNVIGGVIYITHATNKNRSKINENRPTFNSNSLILEFDPSKGLIGLNAIGLKDLKLMFNILIMLFPLGKIIGFEHMISSVRLYLRGLFLKRYLVKTGSGVLYTDYEALELFITRELIKEDKVISCSSSVSHGFNINGSRFSHLWKSADINFVWGEFHKQLFRLSNDQSCHHLSLGYFGDQEILTGSKISSADTRKVVIYDNTTYRDLYHDRSAMDDFLLKSIERCLLLGFNVVLKAKFDNDYYGFLLKKFSKGFSIDHEKASISQGVTADLILTYGLTSPAITLLAAGKKVLVYATEKMHDERIFGNAFDKNCYQSLDLFLRAINTNDNETKLESDLVCYHEKSYKIRVAELIEAILQKQIDGIEKSSILEQIVAETANVK
jgi:hypothetical protein